MDNFDFNKVQKNDINHMPSRFMSNKIFISSIKITLVILMASAFVFFILPNLVDDDEKYNLSNSPDIYISETSINGSLEIKAILVPSRDTNGMQYKVFWKIGDGRPDVMRLLTDAGNHSIHVAEVGISSKDIIDKNLSISYYISDYSGKTIVSYYSPVIEVLKNTKNDLLAGSSLSISENQKAMVIKPASNFSINNPLKNFDFFIDQESLVAKDYSKLIGENNPDSNLIGKIANVPTGIWITAGTRDVESYVKDKINKALNSDTVPIFVAYYMPKINCWDFSQNKDKYKQDYFKWVNDFSLSIGESDAVVIFEPDASSLKWCVYQEGANSNLVREGIQIFKNNAPNSIIYLDAGHPIWVSVSDMSLRLESMGIDLADGFSINVSNFVDTQRNIIYGDLLSSMLSGSRYVVDTSRNGNGPTPDYQWCNPRGRSLGALPTTETNHNLTDAFLWIKPPGESDGSCNGGPNGGVWWREYALELSKNSDL